MVILCPTGAHTDCSEELVVHGGKFRGFGVIMSNWFVTFEMKMNALCLMEDL